ncbi:MAG: serine/threonine protein kinase [Deltaproteobacteria bacterium]|nr:serine/threonine protein kinase [Deltaproteobacteria bacterium]MBK8240789.1 serine/threonine protein kinase [Deltaproteobacteria bacterium]MBK8714215.1 serine/threonine protein kinase [Deltaproteobacteria bacterium]MBP7285994.1 serine/threonine protein kinase [Nannocystaceae bacterium]
MKSGARSSVASDDTWPWAGPTNVGAGTRELAGAVHRAVAMGRFRPVRRVRSCALSEVFIALFDRDDDGVAEVAMVKRIRPELHHVPEARRLFAHEAMLLGAFDHRGIVRALDSGHASTHGYFATEMLHGRSLPELVRRAEEYGLRMPLRHAISLVASMAEALDHAHGRITADRTPLQVVHADVAPGNVTVTYDGSVKLVDFGCAQSRLCPVERRGMPRAGALAYMSPEQCRGEGLDRRSDVYALGVVLWELATWSRLYRRLAPEQVIARIAIGAVPLPSQVRADIPSELEDVLMVALQPAPQRRFSSAGEFAAALRRLGGAEDPRGLDSWVRRVFH